MNSTNSMNSMNSTNSMNSKNSYHLLTNSAKETELFGEKLGHLLELPLAIALIGDLGTGKTCLVRGLARGLDITENTVSSPTFALANEYYGRLPLYHLDLYRLENAERIMELGCEEYTYSDGITVIEWAERGLFLFPKDFLEIHINRKDKINEREIILYANGNYTESIIAGIRD